MNGPPATSDPSVQGVAGTEGGEGGLASALAAARAHSPRPRSRRRRSRAVWVAVGSAAVALGMVGALLVGAFYGARLGLPSSKTVSTSPGPAGPGTFYEELDPALAVAASSYWDWPAGGPPLVFAEGLAWPAALGQIVNSSHLGTASCSPTLLSTDISNLPPYNGTVTAGLAPGWLFAFAPGVGSLLVMAVVNGTAGLVASTTTTGACYDGPGSFNTVVVDSSVAAKVAAATSDSRSFLAAANTSGDPVGVAFRLVPPGYLAHTPMDPMWIVNDTTCELYGATSGPGALLSTEVNAATGVLYAQTTTSVTC